MIEKATLADLPVIKQLTEHCAVAMQEMGIFQWNRHYPSLKRLVSDVEKEELYVLRASTGIAGIVVLTTDMDEEYLPINWMTESGNNLYVHRLATRPEAWGNGHGRALMDFAEGCAREKDLVSVRLDTFSKNIRNQKFYECRGYKRLGNVFFPMQSPHPFYCYEKVL